MKSLHYYICPICSNVIVSLSEANVSCCGRPVEISIAEKATEVEKKTVHLVEDEHFITSSYQMTKENYISFTVFATGEKLEVIKHFPEWNLEMRITKIKMENSCGIHKAEVLNINLYNKISIVSKFYKLL